LPPARSPSFANARPGALVRAGMGYASYAEIAARLEKSARLMLG